MLCSCTVHFDQQLLDHIEFHRNADAKLILNEDLAKASNCRGTLLHHAAVVGNKVISKHLIDMGSLVDSSGPGVKTPLMLAMERGKMLTVRVLLEAGADINVVDADGESALHKALQATFDHLEIVEAILLRARAETPATEELIERLLAAGCTFPYFVFLRDVDVLENLLQRGYKVNSRSSADETALHFAALIKDSKSAELLVARGADVNAFDYCSTGPLYCAAEAADPGMMRLLLDHGADPDPEVDYIKKLPLYACFSVIENDVELQVRECAELLLEHGAFPWQPRTLVQQIQLRYNEILRSSRLNCLVAHQAALDADSEAQNCEEGEHLRTFVELREYYDKCREILKIEVAEKLTILKLLFVDSYHEMRLRARVQRFVHQVEHFCEKPELVVTFPYYAKILSKKIAKAVRAVELEKRAFLVVSALFNCDYNQLSIFARQVVSYLSEHDLEQLCHV